MIHVLFIVIELQALLLSNNIIDAISVLLLFLGQKYHSSYSTATQRGIVDIERPQTSFYMEYEKPSFLAQSAIMMADCQRKPCGRPSCTRKPSGTH